MPERGIPVYLITGFIESGKTSFLNYTLQQRSFRIPGKTLLIKTEEGEVDYNEKDLKAAKVIVETLESKEELTPES